MNKRIFLLRHAKSSWDDFSLKDFDRPLSTRGIQDADLMGNYFNSKKIWLDRVISSPSKRTMETATHFFPNGVDIDTLPELYHASLEQVISTIQETPNDYSSALLIGHNPSMHESFEFLSGKLINKYPTCDYHYRIVGISDAHLPQSQVRASPSFWPPRKPER